MGEVDPASKLLDDASNCVGDNRGMLLDLKLRRAEVLRAVDRKPEALGLLQAILPEVKVNTANPNLYGQTMLQIFHTLLGLDRYQEAHEAAAELVAHCKVKFGMEDPKTMAAMTEYASICAMLGRVEEAKAIYEDLLTTQTRVLGRDHPSTQSIWQVMRIYGFAEPSG